MLSDGLDEVMEHSSGVLTYNGQSISVYKSFVKAQTNEMEQNGYGIMFDDLHVMAPATASLAYTVSIDLIRLRGNNIDR